MLGSLALFACALPPEQTVDTAFVSRPELRAVNFAKEGVYYAGLSRFVDAEFSLRKALFLSPNSRNLKLSLAGVLERLGEYEEAQTILNTLLPEAKAAHARILERAKSTVAPRVLTTVVSQQNEVTLHKILMSLGRNQTSQSHYSQARKYYLESLRVAEELNDSKLSALSAQSLSALALRLGEEEEALCYALLDVAFQSDKDSQVRLARVLTGLGLYQLAVQKLSTHASLNSLEKEPEVLAALAYIYFGREQYADVVRVVQLGKDLATRDNPSEQLSPALLAFSLSELQKANATLPSGVNLEDSVKLLREQGDNRSSLVTIFWPANLVQQLLEFDFEQPSESE